MELFEDTLAREHESNYNCQRLDVQYSRNQGEWNTYTVLPNYLMIKLFN